MCVVVQSRVLFGLFSGGGGGRCSIQVLICVVAARSTFGPPGATSCGQAHAGVATSHSVNLEVLRDSVLAEERAQSDMFHWPMVS